MTNDSFEAANAIWVEIKPPPWWLVLIEGILVIALGIFLLVSPFKTFVAFVWALGLYWLVRGVLNLISLIWDRRLWVWKIVAGVLGLLAGWIVIQNPFWGAVVVSQVTVWMLALTAIFFGVMDIIRAFKGGGWTAAVLGAISIALGVLLLTNTLAATAALPMVLGILAVLAGLLLFFGAFQLRKFQKGIDAMAESVQDSMR